jgi:FkbM family methyltransferase
MVKITRPSEIINSVDQLLRRNTLLPRLEWLRNLLRKPYHRMLKTSKTGFQLNIGGALPVRLPGEFCSKEQEFYEVETAAAIRDWSNANPGGIFVDVGCSFGYFSCGVLFNDEEAQVIAIDADVPSLAITKYVCSYAAKVDQRLKLFRTLIGAESTGEMSFAALLRKTEELLDDPQLTPDPQKTNYVYLDSRISEQVLPRLSLDDLVGDLLKDAGKPCMVKCDVEGAELAVLQGMTRLMREFKPTLLFSVHPPFLPKFSGSVEEIRDLLEQAEYSIDLIAVDHEEHWLCRPY